MNKELIKESFLEGFSVIPNVFAEIVNAFQPKTKKDTEVEIKTDVDFISDDFKTIGNDMRKVFSEVSNGSR